MAPEQARGEIDRLDERCRRLRPGLDPLRGPHRRPRVHGPLLGRDPAQGSRAATWPTPSPGSNVCGADAELIALARSCLSPEPDDRPRHAGECPNGSRPISSACRRSSKGRRSRRVEERARRRLTLVAACGVILFTLACAGGWGWVQRRRVERVAETNRLVLSALDDASRLLSEAKAGTNYNMQKWSEAFSIEQRAEGLTARGEASPSIQQRIAELRQVLFDERDAALEAARRIEVDRTLLADLDAIRTRMDRLRHPDLADLDADTAAAFRKAGVNLETMSSADAAKWISGRSVADKLVSYLDDWAYLRKKRHLTKRPKRPSRRQTPHRHRSCRRSRPLA